MDYFGDAVAQNLLRHYDPADVSLVLEDYFKVEHHDPQAERLLTPLLRAAGAERYYTEFKDHHRGDILDSQMRCSMNFWHQTLPSMSHWTKEKKSQN